MIDQKVSVYIPTCNRVRLLQRAVNSVLSQTYSNIELVIIDDFSSDETYDYILNLSRNHRNVVIHRNDQSLGACESRNIAIRMCSGVFITGLDDDDYFLPDRISLLTNFWKTESQKYSDVAFVYDDPLKITRGFVKILRFPKIVNGELIKFENVVGSQVFSTREKYIAAGLFSIEMQAWQDWDFWCRFFSFNEKTVALNANSVSYVIDEAHEFHRISNKPQGVMVNVFNVFCRKHKITKLIPRSIVMRSLAGYVQVNISPYKKMALLVSYLNIAYLRHKISSFVNRRFNIR